MKIINELGVLVFEHKHQSVVWRVFNNEFCNGGFRVVSLGW